MRLISTLALALAVLLGATALRAEDEKIPADTKITTTASGLKYSVLESGDGGASPKMGDKVRVHYTGWLESGLVFDSSRARGEPAEFVVGQVIAGWNEALAMMSVGDRYKLTIPANLAYGSQSRGKIPANSTLIFDVKLLGIIAMPRFREADPKKQVKTESGLVYEVLTPGEGEAPTASDVVELSFALWNTSGKLIECSERAGQKLTGTNARLPFPFLKEMALLMKPGMRVRCEVPAKLGLGARGAGPDLPPNSPAVWELELTAVKKPLPVPAFVLPAGEGVKTTPSGLKYQVIKEGSGPSPALGQFVTVHYAGWLTDGTLFDNSFERAEPMSFQLGRVIAGWNEGLVLMKPGAIYRFLIPAHLAYGNRQMGPHIRPGSTLIFHVELIRNGK